MEWNGMQDSNINHHVPIPFPGAQNHYIPPNSHSGVQYQNSIPEPYSSMDQTSYPQNTIPNIQDPSMPQDRISSAQYPFVTQTGPSVSIPASTGYPSIAQTGPSDSIPTKYPQNTIPSAQDPSMPQTRVSPSIPTSSNNHSVQYPSMAQTGPSDSIPTSYPQNPIPSAHDHSTPQTRPLDSTPTEYPQNPIPSAQDPSTPQNGLKDKELMHFSHPHKLSRVNLHEDQEDEVICSGCEETLVGNGYSCFTYHCSVCEFDLHIQCASLLETFKREDHEHELKLLYSCPVKDYSFSCDVCHGEIQKDRWWYYCEPCDYGTHLGCDCEECERDTVIDPQAQLQRLQLQMQMARQQAQFMASLGASLSSLIRTDVQLHCLEIL
ncbi:hypothetical protein L1987_39382 [Smallanthus sonchifolius]|uniref:Uncharacterized protein n=1 Tax=Smallanthus sonchifolius TaxID=185202 RepID=A0ACB9HL79_9ASTR|nr:hypothetical protein L1987_39382 [Smallanthus sonchifolius]